MDQREVVKLLKKQYFWGVNVLIVLVALGCWWMATSTINKQYVKRKGEIDKHVDTMSKLANKPNPANDKVVEAIDKEKIADMKKGVSAAWDTLYKEQQQKNRYPETLGKDFQKAFEALQPGEELSDKSRELYGSRVRDHWKKVFAEIGIPFPTAEEGTRTDPNRRAPEAQGIVDWDTTDAKRFLARYEWTRPPSTAQVRLAQEDLWVYEALLRVIKNTNGDATNRYAAAVKRIDALDIGQDFFSPGRRVAGPALERRREGPRGPMPEVGVGRGGLPPGMAPGAQPPAATPETPAAGGEQDVPDNRYVGAKFEALKGADKAPYEEFRMMPVRMRLLIDQRKLAKLLVECANSSMPIEARKVSFFFTRGEARRAGLPGAPEAGSIAPPHEMTVELEGTIYIYNPPKVKVDSGDEAGKKSDAPEGAGAAKDEAGKTEVSTKTEAAVKTEPATKPEPAAKTEPTAKPAAAEPE